MRPLSSLLILAAVASVAVSGCSSSKLTADPAGAAGDMVTAVPSVHGGPDQTVISLDAGTLKALTGLGAALTSLGTAQFNPSTNTLDFPITSGYVELHSDRTVQPGYVIGSLNHEGSGFGLTIGAKSVQLENFVVDPGSSKVYGDVVVNGAAPMLGVELLDLDGTHLQITNPLGELVLTGSVATLSATAATALDSVFGTTALSAATVLGVAQITVDTATSVQYPESDTAARIPRLTGVGTSVILDPGTLSALKTLGLGIAVAGSATADAATGTVTFPITGGAVVIHKNPALGPGYVQGIVSHDGSGLVFSLGGKSLQVSDFQVDPGNSVLTATVAGVPGFRLLDLDGSGVMLQKDDAGNPVLYGTVAKLSPDAANALNATFGTTAVMPETPLGIVRLDAMPAS